MSEELLDSKANAFLEGNRWSFKDQFDSDARSCWSNLCVAYHRIAKDIYILTDSRSV